MERMLRKLIVLYEFCRLTRLRKIINLIGSKVMAAVKLGGLTIMDENGHAVYGTDNAYILKGIPDGFVRTVKRDGFAMSEPLIGLDGNRRVLFGNALSGNRLLYASLPADSMQKACGETTYLGEGYSYILGRDGRGVIPPVRYSYEQVYVNIRHPLDNADNSPDRIADFIAALDAGETGPAAIRRQNRFLLSQ